MQQNIAGYQKFIDNLEHNPVYAQGRIREVVEYAGLAARDASNLVVAIIKNQSQEDLERLRLIWGSSESRLDSVLADLMARNKQSLNNELANFAEVKASFIAWTLGLIGLLAASFVLKFYLIRRYLVLPLKDFDGKVQGILATGNLEPILLNDRTEIGRLGNAFDQLMMRIIADESDLKLEIESRTTAEQEARRALSELEQAKDSLVRSEKLVAVGTMVGGVAHEINNPLMGLMAYLEKLNRDISAENDRALIAKAQQQVRRIERIVKSMLIFSRAPTRAADTGEGAKVQTALNLVLDLLEPFRKKSNARIEIHIPADLPNVRLASDQLQQVLLNLLKNAVDALEDRSGMTEEPVIGCSAELKGDRISIEVSDNGKGVPDDVVPRLFEPFFTTKEPGKGTGLGLPVSLHLAEMAGGTILYAPRNLGGAVFSLQLPMVVKK